MKTNRKNTDAFSMGVAISVEWVGNSIAPIAISIEGAAK